MRPRLLSVSNGHGEDLIAAEILRHLAEAEVEVVAYPLVGLGEAYPPQIARLEPRRTFPSGGFAFRQGNPGLLADFRSGFIRFWLAQRRTLAEQRGRLRLALAVGDYYCLAMALRAGAPAVLVASADSVFGGPFGPLPLQVLRRARRVFTRDAPTAEYLRKRRVRAECLGNPMLDCLRPTGTDFGLAPDQPVITLLPGSRIEAARNAVLLAQVAARVGEFRSDARFLLSLAPTVDEGAVTETLRQAGGQIHDSTIQFGGARLLVTRAFADAIARAVAVVGMAGTAHEQAAGLGKPVVAFPGPGPQFTRAFLDLQRKLLGEAVVAVSSPDQAAGAILRLLSSPEELRWRGQVGRERMGEPGAAARIAAEIRALLAAPEV